jgi:hypothetical protein
MRTQAMFLSANLKTACLTVAGATCLTLGAALPSLAITFTYTGTTAGQPTWNRPFQGTPPTPPASGVGTNVPYNVFEFTVDTAGLYDFLSVGTNPVNWDNYTFLYQNSFNPAQPFTNVLIGNDDFPSIGQSGFNGVSLATGTSYFFVTTGFGNSDAGAFTNTISGLGNVTPVPTPALVPGAVALCAGLLRKRKAEAAVEETSKV